MTRSSLLQIAATALPATVLSYTLYCMARAGMGPQSPIGILFALIFAGTLTTAIGGGLLSFGPVFTFSFRNYTARKRAASGKCTSCGYSHDGAPVCPECGQDPTFIPATNPAPFLLRIGLSWFTAMLLGFALGELRMNLELDMFRREAAALCARTGQTNYYRIRSWPAASSGMFYDATTGKVWTND